MELYDLQSITSSYRERLLQSFVTPLREDVDTPRKSCRKAHLFTETFIGDDFTLRDYSFDVINLDAAKEHLGLKWPVDISKTGYSASGGCYLCHKENRFKRHSIQVHHKLPSGYASMTLWHELTHAKQCEESGLTPYNWFDLIKETQGYSVFLTEEEYCQIPIEKEAYASAVNHFDVAKLAKNVQTSNT